LLNELKVCLFSRRVLARDVAHEQLTFLSEFEGGLLRPDKWDIYEPIKRAFDNGQIALAADELSKPHGTFLFKKGRPRVMEGSAWNLTHPPTARFPGPLFSTRWFTSFSGRWATRIALQTLERFATEMLVLTQADFGFVTTTADLKAKNTDSTHLSYQGFDLGKGLPGLYWLNFFSEELANWLRITELPSEIAHCDLLTNGRVCLRFCTSPDACREPDVLNRQKMAIQSMGVQRFFDINRLDDQLESYPWQLQI
jgi:hypothetical protein